MGYTVFALGVASILIGVMAAVVMLLMLLVHELSRRVFDHPRRAPEDRTRLSPHITRRIR